MNQKVKLFVLGFSFNQKYVETFGLVLAEEAGNRRLVILIGALEVQSIAFKLQEISPPRPLSHDLIESILNNFNIKLIEVNIYKYDGTTYYSKLILEQDNKRINIESRTSDAISIALRTNSPIYTTEEIMDEIGINIDIAKLESQQETDNDSINIEYDHQSYSLMALKDLKDNLAKAVKKEDYEQASLIRDEINKRNLEK